MPIYSYKCGKCNGIFDVQHSINDICQQCILCGTESPNKLLTKFRRIEKDERKELAKERIDRYINESKQENKQPKRKDLE